MNKRLILAATAGALAMHLPAQAQHIDVLAQVMNGQLVTGAANYDNNTWLVGQRVFKRQFFSNFRTPDPGFTTLATGNPLLEPGVQGLAASTNLFLDIVPSTIDGQSANFWWWDGVDPDDDGFTLDDVAFGLAPAGVTWEVLDEDFTKHIADGSDTMVPGAFIQEAFDDGDVHNHLVLQLADNDGDSQTSPPQGVYLVAMVLQADGFDTSEPFFFVHRTSGLSNEPRDIAADWVNANYDALVSEPLEGDFNLDGLVDAADYTVWRDGLGAEFVNEDYDLWRNNYGAQAPASNAPPAAAGVPEPTSAGVLLTLAFAAAACRPMARNARR
ncbi:hypothetical protein MalM25_20390 [Planctomycetes bacterium MalM25]|nr:hypothetical protein MalM25_20390 [Planctomycetes bacterium MalM25]